MPASRKRKIINLYLVFHCSHYLFYELILLLLLFMMLLFVSLIHVYLSPVVVYWSNKAGSVVHGFVGFVRFVRYLTVPITEGLSFTKKLDKNNN